jgi:hypothetical protein
VETIGLVLFVSGSELSLLLPCCLSHFITLITYCTLIHIISGRCTGTSHAFQYGHDGKTADVVVILQESTTDHRY